MPESPYRSKFRAKISPEYPDGPGFHNPLASKYGTGSRPL